MSRALTRARQLLGEAAEELERASAELPSSVRGEAVWASQQAQALRGVVDRVAAELEAAPGGGVLDG